MAFRKAVAQALNTNAIADRAYFGSLPPATDRGHDRPAGPVGAVVAQVAGVELQPLRCHVYAGQGRLQARRRASWSRPAARSSPPQHPHRRPGWTDYISIAQTISAGAAAASAINTNVLQEPYATYSSGLTTGNYDMAVSWGNDDNSTPYYEYYDLLGSRSRPPRQNRQHRLGALHQAVPRRRLNSYASTSNLAVQKQDMARSRRPSSRRYPVVALTARPNWFDYSTKYFAGWPSASDPYNSGDAPTPTAAVPSCCTSTST